MKIIANLIRKLTEKGKTVIIITHDLEFVSEVADTICYISSGKIKYHKELIS